MKSHPQTHRASIRAKNSNSNAVTNKSVSHGLKTEPDSGPPAPKHVIDLGTLKGQSIDKIVGPRSPVNEIIQKIKYDQEEPQIPTEVYYDQSPVAKR